MTVDITTATIAGILLAVGGFLIGQLKELTGVRTDIKNMKEVHEKFAVEMEKDIQGVSQRASEDLRNHIEFAKFWQKKVEGEIDVICSVQREDRNDFKKAVERLNTVVNEISNVTSRLSFIIKQITNVEVIDGSSKKN
jgi:hypothetical protein